MKLPHTHKKLVQKARAFALDLLQGNRLVGADVGAALGLEPHWWALHGVADFYCFEPHEQSARELERMRNASKYPEKYHIMPFGLSGKGGTRILHVANVRTGSSLMPIRDEPKGYLDDSYFFPAKKVPIKTRSLQSVFDEAQEERVDLIKLDIEGAELEVLKGLGQSRIRNLLCVEMEINLHAPARGQPDFNDVDAFMRKNGMELYNVQTGHVHRVLDGKGEGYPEKVFNVYPKSPGISGRAWLIDVVYFRKAEPLIKRKDNAALRKLCVAYCTYNHFIEAYDVVARAEKAGVFDETEADAIKKAILGWHRKLYYRFWDSPGFPFNKVRWVLDRLGIGDRRWSQYHWTEYPNG